MTELEREKLKELQKILMRIYAEVESNLEQYENYQALLDDLDEKVNRIEWLLQNGG